MARYKVLKSVAHNIGHSFTSLMNYADDDYVMGHILRFARSTGRDTLTLDFARREAGPPELLAPPISEVPARYTEWFWDLVQRHGSDRSLVQSATLTLRYDIATKRPLRSARVDHLGRRRSELVSPRPSRPRRPHSHSDLAGATEPRRVATTCSTALLI